MEELVKLLENLGDVKKVLETLLECDKEKLQLIIEIFDRLIKLEELYNESRQAIKIIYQPAEPINPYKYPIPSTPWYTTDRTSTLDPIIHNETRTDSDPLNTVRE